MSAVGKLLDVESGPVSPDRDSFAESTAEIPLSQPQSGWGVGSGGLSVLEAVLTDPKEDSEQETLNVPAPPPQLGEPRYLEYHAFAYLRQFLHWCSGYKIYVGYACFVSLLVTVGLAVMFAILHTEDPDCNVLRSGWWKDPTECPSGHALVKFIYSAIVCMMLVFVYSISDLYDQINDHLNSGKYPASSYLSLRIKLQQVHATPPLIVPPKLEKLRSCSPLFSQMPARDTRTSHTVSETSSLL